MTSQVNSTKHLEKKIIPIFQKFFQEIEEGICPTSFYKANIILILKLDKYITTKLQTNIPHEYRSQNFNKILTNHIR